MPAVVAMELLSGTRDKQSRRTVDKLLRPFVRNRRIILPSYDDYTLAGEVVAELQWAATRHSNDVMIAVLARKVGAELLTTNQKDFSPVCRILKLSVV